MIRAWQLLSIGALLAAFACGEQLAVGVAPPPPLSDAAPAEASTPDAGTCDPNATFGDAVIIGDGTISGSATHELSVTLTDDELTLVFGRLNLATAVYDIMVASRSDRNATFGAPTLLSGVTLDGHDTHPWISPDGLTLIFASNRMTNTWDLFQARRASSDVPFGVPTPLYVDAGTQDFFPFATADGTELFYSEQLLDTTSHIRHASRSADGQIGESTVVDLGDADGGRNRASVLTHDGLTLYFSSNRASDAGLIDEIFVTRRPDRASPFGPPTSVSELNTDTGQWPGWLSPDGCRLYFTRLRDTSIDVFMAARKM